VFLPDNLVAAFSHIENKGRIKATIIAGENVSNLIPAFLDRHAVNGRRDAYPDYTWMIEQVNDIYFRRITDAEIYKRLENWNVQYIIFGIDHIEFNNFVQKGELARIKPVYTDREITVGEYIK
jgi:hypothetical protein